MIITQHVHLNVELRQICLKLRLFHLLALCEHRLVAQFHPFGKFEIVIAFLFRKRQTHRIGFALVAIETLLYRIRSKRNILSDFLLQICCLLIVIREYLTGVCNNLIVVVRNILIVVISNILIVVISYILIVVVSCILIVVVVVILILIVIVSNNLIVVIGIILISVVGNDLVIVVCNIVQ
ncbi:hypothetical protein DSECCO2_551010 [anaerobic digester metagenome]